MLSVASSNWLYWRAGEVEAYPGKYWVRLGPATFDNIYSFPALTGILIPSLALCSTSVFWDF